MRRAHLACRAGEALLSAARPSPAALSSRALPGVAQSSQSQLHTCNSKTRHPLHQQRTRPCSITQHRKMHCSRVNRMPASPSQALSGEDYEPAQTWDGLETVGGERDWNTGKTFHTFGPPEPLQTPEEIRMAAYRAVVEVYTVELAGMEQSIFGRPKPGGLINDTSKVSISWKRLDSGESEVVLHYPSKEVIGTIVASIKDDYSVEAEQASPEGYTVDSAAGMENISAVVQETSRKDYTQETLSEQLRALGRRWLSLPLTNDSIKLAIIRRMKQLTGLHLPDRAIAKVQTVQSLVAKLSTPPPPAKLAEELEQSDLAEIGNIQLFPRRHTPIDKERAVGRWKIIEEELQKQNLPVVGRW